MQLARREDEFFYYEFPLSAHQPFAEEPGELTGRISTFIEAFQ